MKLSLCRLFVDWLPANRNDLSWHNAVSEAKFWAALFEQQQA
jgi:hypothetical protein